MYPNILLLDAPDSSTTQVREHIESLVESLVGKNLDDAKVIQLFDHPSCKYFLAINQSKGVYCYETYISDLYF